MKRILGAIVLSGLLAGCAVGGPINPNSGGGYWLYGPGGYNPGGAGPYDYGPQLPTTGATYMGGDIRLGVPKG